MQIVSIGDNLHVMSKPVFWEKYGKYHHCFWKRNCQTSATVPQVQPIKENLSNLLELASDGNCSLFFEEINQHLASAKIDPWSLSGRVVSLWTSDHKVLHSKPAEGGIQLMTTPHFIAYSLSFSPFHHLGMTQIMLKGA